MGTSEKVEGEEAEVVTGEVVLFAGVAEGENEFHKDIVAYLKGPLSGPLKGI